jgi:hypothetical protein
MGAVWRQGKKWMDVLRSGQRELDRCCRGRMRRYPDCLVLGPGLSQQGGQRLRLRIDRSKEYQFICKDVWTPTQGLTKMTIPSASFCQRSAISLSSSFAASEYIEKSGPELSPKLDSPCNGRFDVVVRLSPQRLSTIDS